jgi:tryptophan synthase alpha chain
VRQEVSHRVEALAAEVRRHTNLPIAVGFGVSRPEHAERILQFADGVIIGSAFIRQIEETLGLNLTPDALSQALKERVSTFTESFRRVMSVRGEQSTSAYSPKE